jgi:hypothetical protein
LPREEPTGRNPPDGALIDYWLANDAKGPVTLRVLDGSGREVQRFSSTDAAAKLPAERYFEERWIGTPPRLSTRAGAHRFAWNLRMPRPPSDAYGYSIAAVDGDATPLLPQGMLVAPGRYTLVLSANGHEDRSTLDVVADPRVAVDATALTQALALSKDVAAALAREVAANGEIQAVAKQLKALRAKTGLSPALTAAAAAFDAALSPLVEGEGELAPLNVAVIGGELGALQSDLEASDAAPTAPQRELYAQDGARLDRALQQWAQVKANDLPKLDAALKTAGMPTIDTHAAPPESPDVGVSRERP